MLWAIVNTVIQSITKITWKKSLEAQKVSHLVFAVFGIIGGLLLTAGILGRGKYDHSVFTNTKIILLCVVIGIIFFIYTPLSQEVTRQEKISVLLPYDNVNRILTIIIGFLLFQEASLTSFIITLIAAGVIIAFSIDFRARTVPRNIRLVLIVQCLTAVNFLLIGYALAVVDSLTFFTINRIIFALMLFTALIYTGKYVQMRGLSPRFLKYRLFTSLLGNTSTFITWFLISGLGLVVTILLSFLTIVSTLLFSYLFFGDKPSTKSIIQTIIISALVGLGFYFR